MPSICLVYAYYMALRWLWVALGWLCTPESMPSICLVYAYYMALRWLWVALGGLTSPAADDRKRGHSRQDCLCADKYPRGSGLFHPPSTIRYTCWPQCSRPGSVPKAVRSGRHKERRERPKI